jgi:hypothetical protein
MNDKANRDMGVQREATITDLGYNDYGANSW